MRLRIAGTFALVIVASLSGCYIDGGGERAVGFGGNVSSTETGFSMSGELLLSNDEANGRFHNISAHFYSDSGAEIYREHVGSFRNGTGRLPITVQLNETPHYIVLLGPGLYEKSGHVEYLVYDEDANNQYRTVEASKRCELPVTDDCN